ncbi:MAG: HAD-IA family hydrolase [Phycisphaerales bacterium]
MSTPPRVACFDLGGVVIRICQSWEEGCRAAGVPMRFDADRELDRARMSELVHAHQTGAMESEEFHRRVSDLMRQRHSPAELRRIHDAWILGAYDGLEPLLDRLHRAGLETACLSNTNHDHWAAMESIPAFRAIRRRHASHLLRLAKPDPAIYRAFEAATGFDGRSIIFFDDLIPNVEAARQAGWTSLLVDPSRPTEPQIREGLERHGVRLP